MNLSKFLKPKLWSMAVLIALSVIATSCDDDDDIDTVTITIDDAAELVAYSVANRTYGAVNNLNYVAEEVLELVSCNESQSNEETVSDASSNGEITVAYNLSENYSKSCEGKENITYTFTIEQVLTSIRFDLDHDINGSWTIEGVQDNSTEITYNGPYNRSGLWTYNSEENHTDNVTYSSSFIDLTYDPNSGRITGGRATFTLDGTSTVYDPFSYSGDIEFLGSDVSIITFSTGEQYELNLETGEITLI